MLLAIDNIGSKLNYCFDSLLQYTSMTDKGEGCYVEAKRSHVMGWIEQDIQCTYDKHGLPPAYDSFLLLVVEGDGGFEEAVHKK